MERSAGRRWLGLVAVCALGACGSDVAVVESLTVDGARARIVALAEEVVAALPPGTTLALDRAGDSFTPDDPVGPTGCLPVEHPDGDPGAVLASWSGAGTSADLEPVAAAWTGQGWVVEEPAAATISTTTAEGYLLTVAHRGSGRLTVAAASPCVPRDDRDPPSTPLPTTLPG